MVTTPAQHVRAPTTQSVSSASPHTFIGAKAIAMMLNGEGYRTNQGRLFGLKFILRVLRNRAYIGILDYNLQQTRGPREPIVVPGFYPTIIEQALFERVQERLAQLGDNWQNPYSHRTSYLLSRLVVCDSLGVLAFRKRQTSRISCDVSVELDDFEPFLPAP